MDTGESVITTREYQKCVHRLNELRETQSELRTSCEFERKECPIQRSNRPEEIYQTLSVLTRPHEWKIGNIQTWDKVNQDNGAAKPTEKQKNRV